MALSMTGYGRGEDMLNGRNIIVEIKSVNSRYFEYSSRMPRSCIFIEDALKKAVNASMSRGKAELFVSLHSTEEADTKIQANLPVARGYYEALADIARDLRIDNDITASSFLRFSDVFVMQRSETDEDMLKADVLSVAEKAIQNFTEMRGAEGSKLGRDIESRLYALEVMLNEVVQGSSERVERYTQKLQERLNEILADRNIDEARLLTEAAIFADKTAVDEETVRLNSHIKQFREILQQEGPIGRKLDFLTQELNREVNTIGSKCQELEITRLVVGMKAEIEKIREQIQNIE